MILIYSKHIDGFVNHVIDYLDKDFIRIGDRDKIEIKEISIDDKVDFNVSGDYFDTFGFNKIKSIWFNGWGINASNNPYENKCYQSLVDSFLTNLQINKIGRIYHEFETNKLYAALEAKKQGFKVPETLITGSKSKLTEFYSNHVYSNGIVCKRIMDSLYYGSDDYIHNFNSTFPIDLETLNKIPQDFALSLFQERILAEYEIRVVYINGKLFAMAVHVFDNVIDYRINLNSSQNMRMIPFKLPNKILSKLKMVFKNLNLNYGSADLMYFNKDFYFLEINPSGQVSFVNEACNFYLECEISKLLESE